VCGHLLVIYLHYCVLWSSSPLSWGLGVWGWSCKECETLAIPWDWLFSWFSFAHLTVIAFFWSFLMLMCMVIFWSFTCTIVRCDLVPLFYGVWVCRDWAERKAKLLQHHKIDLLNLLFKWTNSSSHCHSFFLGCFLCCCVDHFIIIYLHYCESPSFDYLLMFCAWSFGHCCQQQFNYSNSCHSNFL
jgi:hypothetical protein